MPIRYSFSPRPSSQSCSEVSHCTSSPRQRRRGRHRCARPRLAPAGFPQPGRGHPAPQRFAADVDAVALLQILRRQGRPKVGVERFGENRGGSLFHLGADLAVGGAAARRMDYGPVALAAELRQQPPHLPFAEADLLGGLLLGDQLLVGFVSAPPAGRALVVSSVVVLGCSPLQGDLVNRTFLLGTFRTLSLGSDTCVC